MRTHIICAVVFALPAIVMAGQPSAESMKRAAERQTRQTIAKDYTGAYKRAHTGYLNSLSSACQWLIAQQAKTDAEQIVAEIVKVDPKYVNLPGLQKGIGAINAPAQLDEAKKKELALKMKSAAQARAKGLLELAGTCYNASLYGNSFDLVWEILKHDPDNATARKAVGYVKIGDAWQTQYASSQIQKGLKYVPDAGWVPAQAADKVAAGEWFENGRFMSMDEANKLHANRSTPWIIETENFTLKATATRKQAVAIAERLEAIRTCCFRQYLEFFMRPSPKSGQILFVTPPSMKKMVVNYLGAKEDYDAMINTEIKSRDKDLLIRSAGFYTTSTHASYFYHDKNFGPFQIVLMQHEVTHQILGEYARGWTDQTWLAEGIAEVLEAARPGPDGQLVLPRGHDHPDVVHAAELLKKNTLPASATMFGLSQNQFHMEPGRSRNYQVAGAMCRCLLEMRDGSFAVDFLEYLYDAHKGGKVNLSDYIGLDAEGFDKEFRYYLAENSAVRN